jgi:hypothetical protein
MIASRFQFLFSSGRKMSHGHEALDRLVLPGHVVLTDDGRWGRVRRLTCSLQDRDSRLEVEGPDGATCLLSPRDVRFIYSRNSGDLTAATWPVANCS